MCKVGICTLAMSKPGWRWEFVGLYAHVASELTPYLGAVRCDD